MISSRALIYIYATIVPIICSCADAFAPAACSIKSSTALSMGLFDSFTKAFSNEEYGPPPDAVKATARHILVPSLEVANEVLAKVAAGETSFASLASQYSTCPSKSRGGSLGSFSPGTMVREFDEVVFAPDTKVGEIMGPVQTQFGYHLIVVDKRTGGGDWY
jgi:peptidyl-prolyl cis-trans isomerase C